LTIEVCSEFYPGRQAAKHLGADRGPPDELRGGPRAWRDNERLTTSPRRIRRRRAGIAITKSLLVLGDSALAEYGEGASSGGGAVAHHTSMDPRTEQLDLAQDSGAPRRARRFLLSVLTSWGVSGETVERTQLLASELVSNAVLHGRAPIRLRVRSADKAGATIRVEVSDAGTAAPTVRTADRSDPSGRGLQLVADLARCWGTSRRNGATQVWFELGG
jgi:serine/threonine-protein kinase RsbW